MFGSTLYRWPIAVQTAPVHRIWRSLLVLAAATLVFGVSLAGAARSGDFRDEFTTLDVHQWYKSTRPFGWGVIDPANVGVSGGMLGIKLPGGTQNGGEVRRLGLTRYGSYRARIKVANAPSSLTAFFLYRKPDFEQELDIEIFNDSSGRVWYSTYSGGAQTHTVDANLGFDPTAAFHDYTIEYDPGSVRFLVDGVERQSWTTGLPRSSMYMYVNAWFPSWLPGTRPANDAFTYVDWVEHLER
jgi:beta-glucanase (GH16 family)